MRNAGLVVSILILTVSTIARAATPPVEQNPFAPAIDQVNARFSAIQAEIARLQGLGQNAQAAAMQAQLTQFQNQLTGAANSNGVGSELDIVGHYEGFGYTNGGPPGTAAVRVNATDRPIVLAIGSYDPCNWTLTIDPGAQIERIIFSRRSGIGQIVNPPPGVPVTVITDYLGRGLDYESYPAGERLLRTLTGRPVTSAQGIYTAPGTPIVVGNQNADWRAQRVLREMQPLYVQATAFQRQQQFNAVSSIQFSGLLQGFTNPGEPPSNSTHAIMSPVAPFPNTGKVLPSAFNNFVLAPGGAVGYGHHSGHFYRVNFPQGQETQMDPTGPGIPTTGNPCAVAYDTTRNRVLLANFTSAGTMYSYVPATNTWSVLNSLNGIDLQSMTYLASNDSLYGLRWALFPGGPNYIDRFDANGNLVSEIQIGAIIAGHHNSGANELMLMAAGDKLALLTPLVPDLYQLDQPDAKRLYIIDPANGNVLYSGIFPVPEPACLGAIAGLLVAMRRRTQTLS